MGLFGKNRRSSTAAVDNNPREAPTLNSTAVSTMTASTSSTRDSSMRKPPVRPQPTLERIAAPPVQANEISLLRDQVLDLERSFNDKDLFDFLLADIDRNRLTQIVTMFADSGQYVDMQGAMELAETLDRLIRRRLDETHQQQRRTWIESPPAQEPDIGQIITEAETTDISTLSVTDLQNRISYFDFHFYRFQDGDFVLLLKLSERIESFRKALRELESRGSLQTVTPEDSSQSNENRVLMEPIVRLTEESSVLSQPAQDLPQDDEVWETFTPPPAPVPTIEPTVCSAIYGPIETVSTPPEHPSIPISSVEMGTDSWERFHNDSSSTQVDGLQTTDHSATVEVYRISSSFQQSNTRDDFSDDQEMAFQELKIQRMKKSAFRAWSLIKHQRDARSKLSHDQSVIRLRSTFGIWSRLSREQQARKAAERASARDEVFRNNLSVRRIKAMRSCFDSWFGCLRESRDLQRTRIRLQQSSIVKEVFDGWRSLCSSREESLSSHLQVRHTMLKRAILTAWVTGMRSSCDMVDNFYLRSAFRVLIGRVNEAKRAEEQASLVRRGIERNLIESIFVGWKELRLKRHASIDRMLNVCAFRVRESFNSFVQNSSMLHKPQVIENMDTIARVVSVVLLREKRAAFDDLSQPLVATPRKRFEIVSTSIHKSPIVQYYSISDPEEAPQGTPPPIGPIEELKQTTNDIIVKAQVFLSQRRLRSPSPITESPTNLDHSRKVVEWLDNHKRSSDKYFTDFERKWAIEEQKWHL